MIPAFNEAKLIRQTMQSIRDHVPNSVAYEVIVVDHGSNDDTVAIAREFGSKVFEATGGYVARLRNIGAAAAAGRVLVFLDADVLLTDGWAESIGETLSELNHYPTTVTGSNCGVPVDATWVERNWFGPQVRNIRSHIGSGHLIVTREFFDQLGGFDESLETGEDYELSRRALGNGGRMRIAPELETVHLGFPRTLKAFIRREAWHGRGDFKNSRTVLKSRVALVAIGFGVAHLVILVGLLTSKPTIFAAGLLTVVGLCVGPSLVRFRGESISVIVGNIGLYYLYFGARLCAGFHAVKGGWRGHGTAFSLHGS